MKFSSIRKSSAFDRIHKTGERHTEMSIRPVKKNASWMTVSNHRSKPEKDQEKKHHHAPGVKDHAEHKNNGDRNESIAQFEVIENHDRRVDRLADSNPVILFERAVVKHGRPFFLFATQSNDREHRESKTRCRCHPY